MFVTAQFPVADVRPFLRGEAGRLPKPAWPFAQPGQEFVRSFGVVRARPQGPLAAWTESTYCDAERVVRLPPGFGRVPVARSGRFTVLTSVYRRLFSDGGAIVRLECGLGTRARAGVQEDLDASGLTHLIGACLAVEVTVKLPESDHQGPLASIGPSFALAFQRATSRVGDAAQEPWMVSARTPMLVVQHAGDPTARISPRFPRIDSLSDADVACFTSRTRHGAGEAQVYVLRHRAETDPDKLRRLRLFLLRRHAQREVIKATLSLIRDKRLRYEPGVEESEALSLWIDKTLKTLAERQAYGFVVGEDARLALGLDDVISPGEADLLVERLEDFRASIKQRVQNIQPAAQPVPVIQITAGGQLLLNNQIGAISMESHSTQISGGITNSQIGGIGSKFSVTDSLNAIEKSSADDELKTLLTQLTDELAKVTAVPEGAAAARDGEDFVAEAASEEPRKGVLEALGNGLKSAAEAVGEVGLPAIALVAKILTLI